MTATATGPNGQPLLSLAASDKIKLVEDQQAHVFLNLQHRNADQTSLDGKGKRQKIKDDEMLVGDVRLDFSKGEWKSVTTGWAVPRQIPDGPHAGKWYIPVPADIRLREQRDPKTGLVTDDIAPAWKNPEIVESDPAWFPSEEL